MPISDATHLLAAYARLLAFLELSTGCPYYPEDVLPVGKAQLRQLFAQALLEHPQDTRVIQEYMVALDRFIPFQPAMQLAKDFQQIDRKHHGLEYDPAAVKRYWKTIHALYGVDEQLAV
jgi:hypothetical protein